MNLLDYFFYNSNTYALHMDDGSYVQVAEPITPELIEDHLTGKISLACYPVLNKMCTFGCLHIKTQYWFWDISRVLINNLGLLDRQIYSEQSEGKETHLWLFFKEPIPASQVIQLFNYCVDKVAANPNKNVPILSNQAYIYPSNNPEESSSCLTVPFGGSTSKGNSTFCDAHGNELSAKNINLNTISTANLQRILRRAHLLPPAIYAPVFKKDFHLLIDKCELISKCYSNPKEIPSVTWLGICTNLYQLGDFGIDALRDFTKQTTTNWNEDEFNSLLIKLDNMPLYNCHKLGCNKSCMVGAPIRHLQEPKLDIRIQEIDNVTIDDVRKYYEDATASVLKDYTPSIILNNGFPGLGKTEALAKQLLESEYSVTWMAPNHEQAEQVMTIWKEKVNAVHLKSRKQIFEGHKDDCPNYKYFEQAFDQGLPARALYCNSDRCDHFEECPYLKLFKEAQSARLVLCMHQHNMYGTVEELNKDIFVIDENPAPCLRRRIPIRLRDISYSLSLASFIKDLSIGAQVTNALEHFKANGKPTYISPINSLQMARINRDIANASIILDNGQAKWLLNDLLYLQESGEGFYFIDGNYVYSRQSWVPKDRPVFVLDATLTVENLRMLLPEHDIIAINPEVMPKQQCDVIHVIGATYGASTLFNKKRETVKPSAEGMLRTIEKKIGKDASIITWKSLVKFAKLEDRFANVGWYGKTRGFNKFNASEKLVLFGFWMKPVDGMVKEAFEHHGILDMDIGKEIHQVELDLEKSSKPEGIQWIIGGKDFMHDAYPVRKFKFTNPYIDSYFNYSVLSELSQAVGRARIYEPSEKKKEVWIITNVMPTHVQATRYIDKEDFMPDLRVATHKEAIKEAISHGADPNSPMSIFKTIRQIGGPNTSLSTVKRYYKNINC